MAEFYVNKLDFLLEEAYMIGIFGILPILVYLAGRFLLFGSINLNHYETWQMIDFGNLALVMMVYTTMISLFILYYAQKNFEREKNGKRWLVWILLTIFSVHLITVSANLLSILLGFICISLFFHQLLLCFPNRKKSINVAWKKFILSRIGDLFFIFFCYSIYKTIGTLELREIHNLVLSMPIEERMTACFWPSIFLGIACMIKSAQFPLHFWLPETIDAPSPISAIMHAGIINAGGFLLLKFHFLYTPNSLASLIILFVGLMTVIVGGLSMLAQVDIKRKLAYSTLGQMGFMMVEFGLGLYPLILLHIIGHGFYKAYGFLAAGSRDLAPVPKQLGVSFKIIISFLILISPIAIYHKTGDIEYGVLTIFFLSLVGSLPKTLNPMAILVSISLAIPSIFLLSLGTWMTGIESEQTQLHPMIAIISLLTLSTFSVFIILLSSLNQFKFVNWLYAYASRGFLFSQNSDKIFNKLVN